MTKLSSETLNTVEVVAGEDIPDMIGEVSEITMYVNSQVTNIILPM